MAYPNPAYDPNWKAVHDYHDAARRQAQEEQLRLGEAGGQLALLDEHATYRGGLHVGDGEHSTSMGIRRGDGKTRAGDGDRYRQQRRGDFLYTLLMRLRQRTWHE
jgi:hypothetical protein